MQQASRRPLNDVSEPTGPSNWTFSPDHTHQGVSETRGILVSVFGIENAPSRFCRGTAAVGIIMCVRVDLILGWVGTAGWSIYAQETEVLS